MKIIVITLFNEIMTQLLCETTFCSSVIFHNNIERVRVSSQLICVVCEYTTGSSLYYIIKEKTLVPLINIIFTQISWITALLLKLEKRISEIEINSKEAGFTKPGPYIYDLLAELNVTNKTSSMLIDIIEEATLLLEEGDFYVLSFNYFIHVPLSVWICSSFVFSLVLEIIL